MKTFSIFEHPTGQMEAVKNGWSWAAFFFGWIWTLVERLYGMVVAVFVSAVSLAEPRADGPLLPAALLQKGSRQV